MGALVGTLLIAAIQFPVGGMLDRDAYLSKVEDRVTEAREKGAELVVFPELTALDLVRYGAPRTEAGELRRIAREDTEAVWERTAELARRSGAAILAGSMPRNTPRGIVNSAALFFPDGSRVIQDKIYLTPDERDRYGWVPGTELKVFDAPWGRTAVLICHDSEFASVSALLERERVEVILVPSMTGPQGFHRVRWSAQARAVEHHAYVVVTGTVDSADGWLPEGTFRGQAAVLTPRDTGYPGVLAEGPADRPAVVTARLDLERLRGTKRTAGIHPARDATQREIPIRVRRVGRDAFPAR